MAAVLVTGCTVNKSTPPPLAGPSELGLALGLSAFPDQVAQDGSSQAVVSIQARDASGQPIQGLPLRVEISVGGVIGDVGSLSTKGPVTGADGRARVTYTAPLSADQAGRTVTILVTPIGSDYAGSMARSVDIRLVAAGGVQPPTNLVAGFAMAPDSPKVSDAVLFSALPCKTAGDTNCTQGSIVSYAWNFGDGSTGSGQVTSHAFATAGNFVVTLTVTGTMGETKTAARVVQVGSGTPPTADFVYSPTGPVAGQQVYFNASASKAAVGRTLVSYEWDFGYGTWQSGIVAQATYSVAGTYTVTLVVTDDIGQKASKSQTVTVK